MSPKQTKLTQGPVYPDWTSQAVEMGRNQTNQADARVQSAKTEPSQAMEIGGTQQNQADARVESAQTGPSQAVETGENLT